MDELDAKEFQRRTALLRDRRHRRRLLSELFLCRGSHSGWTSGERLSTAAYDSNWGGIDHDFDQYWICLLRDLCIKGFIEEKRKRLKRHEKFTLKHLRYRLLSPGLSLCLGSAPPDPDIDDDRAVG
jgi:hypothetical protein